MKKTNLFKRALAVFISVLMVVTMLPSFALTASAATDPNLLAFYFNNSVSAKSVTTNYAGENATVLSTVSEDTLVWNYTENAAEFKGNKDETPRVKLSDLLNGKTCNNSTGFTIQFDAKTNMKGWGNFFEISNSTPYNGTGGTGKTYVYLSASSNSGESYKCHSKVALTNGSESSSACSVAVNDNQWHNFRLVIGQGQLYIFVDGKLQSPGLNDSSRINDNLFNELKNNGYLNFGASAYSQSPAYTGYIRNFMFVNNAKLDIAMAKYENKMNGTVYTNMKPAYDAYVLAKKCAEALRYGDFESYPNIENYADDLNTKTDAMGYYDFSSYKGTVVPKANNVECYNGYSNVLYSTNSWVDGNAGSKYQNIYDGTSANYLKPALLGMSDIVLLYDGVHDTAFPFIFKCQVNKKSNCDSKYRWDYLASEHSDWTLAKNNQTLIKAKAWNTFQQSSKEFSISTDVNNDTSTGNNNNNKCTNEWPWQGACYYNGSGDTNNYYQTYTNAISFKGKCDIRVTWTGGSQWNENKMYTDMRYGTSGSESKTVRVINYKTLREKFNNDTRFNLSGTNYTQGGLSNLIDAYDAAALVNPVSYFTNVSNVETSVKDCANAIKNAVNTIDNANIISDSFRTITAKNGDTTIATFNLSNGCKAKTVECALNMVTPGNGQTETTHYDYEWPATTAVDANKTYSVTRVDNPHEFGDVDVQTPATCETAGVMNTKCSVCDYASTREIKATGHSYGSFAKDWTEYDENETTYTHSKTCDNQGCETPKVTENCSFGEWIVSEDKTTETRKCSVCHGTQTREHQIDKVTVTFKLPTGKVVSSETVDPETEVNAPALDAESFNDAEGHHSFYWESASYVISEDITITAVANEVEAHTTATRNINLQNVTEDLVATSCAENLTYSYDLQTYCTECDYIISTVPTPVERLVHTNAIRNKNSDVHTVYCSVCLKVIEDVAHSDFASVTTAPTCIAQGYTTYTCPCGYSYVADYTDVIAHTFGEYKYNGDNTHTRTCSVCSIDETNTCNIVAEVSEPTCIEPAYSLKHCTICPNVTEKVALDGLTEVHDIIGGYGNYIDISGNKDGEQVFDLGYDVTKMIVEIDSHTWKKNSAIVWESNAWFDIYDYNGNKVLSRNANSAQSDTITLENVRGYLRINYDLYSGSDDYIRVKSIKIIDAKYATKGHDYHYINNNDGADGLLGTHQKVCSRCNDGAGVNLEHNLDLKRVDNTIVASCKDCDFSQVLHTTANTVTVTENNLFDTDKFIRSHNAEGTNETSHGLACFRRTDGKAVVVGNGDNYTKHDRENDYLIPVEGGKTYQFDFDASTTYGDVMLFFRGAGVNYDSNYLSMRKSGTAIGKNTIEFTVPEGGKQLYIRIGTNNSGARNAYCVFSNFALHEKDDPNYRMITNVPMDSAINDILDPINEHATADFCCYKFKNSSISFTDGTIANGQTINRNVNVVADSEHNLYKEFRNGTVAHYYCLDCGYATDKIVPAPSLIYRESFDGTSINGTTLTTGSAFGQNATVIGGNASVIAGFASNGKDGNGNSSDWRNNVLKINANTSQGLAGNSVTLAQNPLTVDEDTKLSAKENGVTISFWRAFNTSDAATIKRNGADYKSIDDQWIEAIAFNTKTDTQGLEAESKYYYFEVNATGANSFNNGNVGSNGRPYYDFIYNSYDDTKHDAGIDNPCWVNVTVSIDPDKGATFYYNGEPHKVSNPNQKLGYENDAAMAKDLLDYITKDSTIMSFAAGDPYNQTEKDLYLDDIRVYTGAMTQVEINNMFTDEYADYNQERLAQGKDIVQNSAGHDPTAVTVYTLPSGKTVGQEYIDYHNIDVTDKSQVIDINYYIFGTGMTIYKSHDNVHWEVVGDDYGRCGYQNQKLYGGEYTVAIKEQLDFANTGHNHAYDGAGYLQWAPHIMYNLNSDCWQYYGSTSSWGSSDSCIFTGNSQSIEGPYTNITTVFASCANYTGSSTPANAIDSCVYYGHNADGSINPDELYMLYGSWQPNYVMQLNPTTGQNKYWNPADPYGTSYGGNEITDGYHYYGKIICAANSESEAKNSGEGGFMIYQDGYYYFYISLGSNYGNYQQRVFRSQYPDRGFEVYNGEQATDTSATHHGMSFLSSYQLPAYDHIFTSVGHNSAYKAVNKNNEILTVDSTHARTFSNGAAMEDQALITRQSDLTGNISIQNMIAYTESKWQVSFPLQYNGYDSTVGQFTAEDIVGTYTGNNLMMSASYNYARPESFTVTACDNDHVYFQIGSTKYTAALTYGTDYAGQDITYITGDEIEGVIAKQGDTFEFSFFNKSTLQHTWGYQTAGGTVSHVYGDYKVVTSATCIANAIEEATCSKCGDTDSREVLDTMLEHSYTGESVHIDADGDNNGYTEYHCVNGCNELGGRVYDTTDWTTYDAVIDEVAVNIANTSKYTAESIEAYTQAVNDIKVSEKDETKSQEYIDNKVTAIRTAESLLVRNKYTVTFNVYVNDKEEPEYKETFENIDYGTVLDLDVTDHMPADSYVYKWTAESDSSQVKVLSFSSKNVSHVVYKGTVINCYLTQEQNLSDTVKVTLKDKNNNITGIVYAKTGSTFSKDGNNLIVDGNTLTAPKFPYYQIKDFCIEGTNTIVTDNNYQVTEDVVIKPVYRAEPKITITTTASDVTINGEVRSRYEAKWDQTITVSNENATAWYADGVLVAIGNTYKFQATKTVNLTYDSKVVTEGSSRIDYAKFESEFNYSRIVVSNCVPEGAEVIEQGIKILTSSKENVPSVASSKVVAGTKKFVAKNTTNTKLQYMFTLTTDDAVKTIAVVSYVTYQIEGQNPVTVWSSNDDTSATMIYKTNA